MGYCTSWLIFSKSDLSSTIILKGVSKLISSIAFAKSSLSSATSIDLGLAPKIFIGLVSKYFSLFNSLITFKAV